MQQFIYKAIGTYLNTISLFSPQKGGERALNLFLTPARPALNDKQRHFLDSGKSFILQHRDTPIQTYQWGTGDRNVLLLHGWQSHSYRWKNFVEKFDARGYKVFALDAPGHGLSGGNKLSLPLYADVIQTFIKQIGDVEGIVAHSIGSFSTLYALYDQQLPVKKFVSLASPGEAREFFDHYQRALNLSRKTITQSELAFKNKFGKTPDYFSAKKFAASLSIPGLIIHDVTDNDTSIEHSRTIHNAWKQSTLLETNGFGHNLRSEEVTNAVVDFIHQPEFVSTR